MLIVTPIATLILIAITILLICILKRRVAPKPDPNLDQTK
jgi:hypothetical protein